MTARRVAVVGGGWAGLAAAIGARERGHHVTLFEASRTLGGRARSLTVRLPDGGTASVDNGQHILVAAYTETLALMDKVGVSPRDALLRLPLTLRFPDGGGLALPDWRPPFDAAAGILGARGWTLADKLSLLRAARSWQLAKFTCLPQQTVAGLAGGLTETVRRELVEPLCVSALNTPAHRADAQVFLRVMQDALFRPGFGGWPGSSFLLPKLDLGRLFPEAAQRWLALHGAGVRVGQRIQAIARTSSGWDVDGLPFERVVLACPVWEAQRLLAGLPQAEGWVRDAATLSHEPITTVYAFGRVRLPLPLLALRSGAGAPAQFVFDRAQLGGPKGLLAFVVSASDGSAEDLQRQVLAQALDLGWSLEPVQTVVEKRATFACTPALARPGMRIADGLLACGDYVAGPYPATLEGAVRAAQQAALALT